MAAATVHVCVLVGLAALIAITYANSLSAGFTLDNRGLILEKPALRAATWDNVATILTHDYWHPVAVNGLYRPLTTLSYLVNYSVFGNAARPLGYHVVNLVVHWACSALCYALMLALCTVPQIAALSAALFALHPIATEAVTNIVGRADLLAALGVLGGLLCHIRAGVSGTTQRRRWLVLLAFAALLGGLSKENAAVLLPLIAAMELLIEADQPWGTRMRRLGMTAAILIGVTGVMTGMTAWVSAHEWPSQASPIDNPILAGGFWSGRGTALEVIGLQVWQLGWPQALSADYSYDQIPLVAWPPGAITLAAWTTVAILLITAAWLRRRQPAVAFLIAFFFIALLPTANLVVVIGSIRADRFLYLPLVGLAGALTLGSFALTRGTRGRRVVTGVLVLAIAACAWRTAMRNRDWATEETLWASAAAIAPRSAKAQKAYAAALSVRDDDLERAIAHAQRAVAIAPDFVPALLDLGGYFVRRGDRLATAQQADQARQAYEHAIALLQHGRALDRSTNRALQHATMARGFPRAAVPELGSAGLYRNLALAHIGLGQLDRALIACRYARRLDPRAVQTYVDISALDAMLGRWDDAAVSLFEAIALDQSNRDAWARLVEVYRILEPGGTALTADGAGRVSVRENAPLVMRHRCRANAELARIFSRARLPQMAQPARRWVAQQCSPSKEG